MMRDLNLNDPASLEAPSIVVSASAGSGKTFTLTALVAARLGRGDLRPYEILATTFSEAAAADLRGRLLRPLDLLASLESEDWRACLPLLEAPDPGEIEACLKRSSAPEALRKSAQEVAQAAAWWGAAEWRGHPQQAQAFWRRTRREAELLRVSTIHSLALGLVAQGDGAPESILDSAHPALLRTLRQALREALNLPLDHPDRIPGQILLAWAEKNWEAISSGHDGHRDAMGHLDTEDPAARSQVLAQALERALSAAEASLAPFAADPSLALDATSPSKRHFKASCIQRIPGPGADLAHRIRWAERQAIPVAQGYFTSAFKEAVGGLKPVADAWEARLSDLLARALGRFEALKAERGQATFGDLVRKALEGLHSGALEPPRPKLLLVDEYQDTSRAQDAFLEALGAERTVRVGDLKQAIYGFRGGDPDLLLGHLKKAESAADGAETGAFRLPSNFRSAPAIVSLANHYVGKVWPELDPNAANLDGDQHAVLTHASPVGLVRTQLEGNYADLPRLADWIAALSTDAGWDRDFGAPERPASRRRALLLNKRTKLPALLRRLKAMGVRPYVVAKDGFWDSPGVRLVMAALEAVAHPERPLPCAVLLRHFAGLSDAELTAELAAMAARRGDPGFSGWDQLDEKDTSIPDAWRELQALRGLPTQAIAGRMLVQGALLRLVSALRVHGPMEAIRARRNLAALLAMLLDLPESPVAAFARLEEERNGQERGDLPASAEGADLVIQTAHASKGLEYDDVILPLLHTGPWAFTRGQIKTDPKTRGLALAWKLGEIPGARYEDLKPIVEERQRRDDLNLFYVALTRARERMCLLLQEPREPKASDKPKSAVETKTWAQWGQHLVRDCDELKLLASVPEGRPMPEPEALVIAPPQRRTGMVPPGAVLAAGFGDGGQVGSQEAIAGQDAAAGAKARQQGEAMHAYLRDLLVRWEDPQAFQRCLDAPPAVEHARENALRFLKAFEAKGWRHLRRRTELPLAGAAASGAEGRADLVVWDAEAIHILDFKHSKAFGATELEHYRAQLQRYVEALCLRGGASMTVHAWLVPLRGDAWVGV
ncbi:MAG TPA: UvrD-helicase domain-containing protein [Holophaga sp.]|nr:UvrD-helicase domain-containing protein [Holophaga sp.]